MPLTSTIKKNGATALLTLGACGFMAAGVATSPALATPPSGDNSHKVTICHATGSDKNPFVTITVDKASIIEGHGEHQDQRDIIPAFTFEKGKGDTVSFAGLNWTASGQAIFNNSCEVPAAIPTPTPTQTETPTPTPTTTPTQPGSVTTTAPTIAPVGAAAGGGGGMGAAQGEVTIEAQTAAGAPARDSMVSTSFFGAGLLMLVSAIATKLTRRARGGHA